MSLYLRGSVWWFEARVNGQRIRESTGQIERGPAELYAEVRTRQLLSGCSEKRTWGAAVSRWMKERSDKASLDRDEGIARWLSGWDDRLMASITAEDIREVLERKRQETSASNANHYLAFIRSIFHKSAEWGWVSTAPSVKAYKVSNTRVRFLTPDEIGKLLQALPAHLAGPVEFSILTGLRQANVVGLRWDWVDLGRGMVRVPAESHKNRMHHGVPLNDRAVQILTRELGKHEEFVFTYNGSRIRNVNNTGWRNALKRAGIKDFRWHDLRHTFASYHAMNGTPLLVLKQLGGWASVDMVNRYAHLSPESMRGYASNSLATPIR